MPDASEKGLRVLRELGLNQLEAEVYAYLLAHDPTTGYRIGKELGRPTANVYKAVDTLARRGAVVVEEGDNRVCRAVPAAEFLSLSRRRYERATREAEEALSSLQRETEDERVYRLEALPAVLERACAMIAGARRVVVVDAFPRAMEQVREALEEAIARGVEVFVEAYEPLELEGARIALVPQPERSLGVWQCEQLNLVVDGEQLLAALLDADLRGVHMAAWSRSRYLACLLHGGRLAEQTVVRMLSALEEGADDAALVAILKQHRFFRDADVPGHRALLERFFVEVPS